MGGIAGLLFSYSIHIYALLVLFHQVVLPLSSSATRIAVWSNLLFYIIYLPLALLAIISLFVASTTNPGAVPMGAKPFTTVRRLASSDSDTPSVVTSSSATTIRRCYKCQDNYKPARAHHDSVTDRCIVKFDHYCPWINNAVGALNHKFFCLFLLYTMLSCLVSGILIVLRYKQCFALHPENADDSVIPVNPHGSSSTEYHTEGDRTLDHGSSNVEETETLRLVNACTAAFWNNHYILLLMLASLLFFFFTLVMGYEQLEAIETGKGKIARMKQSVGHQGTEFSKVTEEFNEMFGGSTPHVAWHWFLPISLRFPRGMQQVVLGYEYDNRESGAGPFQPTTNAEGARDDGDGDATTDVEMGLVHSSSSNDESPDASTEDRSARPLLRSALSREGSSDSSSHSQIKNRKGGNSSSHTEVEDGSLVERTRARLT